MNKKPALPLCPVCNQPVALETAKVDEVGRAIHDECYFAIVRRKDFDIERWIAESGAAERFELAASVYS
jgi:hypothetical protein